MADKTDRGGNRVKELTTELGTTGLEFSGGRIYEEFLSALQDEKGRKVYREMSENDPVVSAVLFAIEMLLRGAPWSVEPATAEEEDQERGKFLETCMHDMDRPWTEVISEILTMLVYGFSVHEVVYKLRRGENADVPSTQSDGKIGWRRLPIRSQSTIEEWILTDKGEFDGIIQIAPPNYQNITIPATKLILFRTTARMSNPEGRALDPETDIPTPSGWRKLDDIKEGDKVFDEMGRIRYVTARKDWQDRPCFRVFFNGGLEIIADEEHQWVTQLLWERSKDRPGKIRTTGEIADTVKNSAGVSNHSIPWAGALDYPEQELVINPYVLGLWLGDGDSRTSRISCHVKDSKETALRIEDCGYSTRIDQNGNEDSNGRAILVYGSKKYGPDGLQHQLRLLGLLENKHIPLAYMRGSVDQRLALLAGLMDSDGTVDKDGRCEFVNTNINLVDGVAELVRSLGVGASSSLRKHANEISHMQDSYCVKFTPPWVPFRLERKAAKIKPVRARENHYITNVERVEPRRTVCIEVDGPSHLYLAGRGMIPTHNSVLRGAYRPWYFKKKIELFEAIGIERDLAGLPFATVPAELLSDSASAQQKAMLAQIKKIIRNIRNDEQAGVIFPAVHDERGNKIFDFKLLSAGGSRMFNTSEVINRKNSEIAMTVLADFILMGQQQVGSFALANSKTEMFSKVLKAWLDSIAETFNRVAVPRLFAVNGWSSSKLPKIVHGDIEAPDLYPLAAFIRALADSGAMMFPDETLERHLRRIAGLPEPLKVEY